MPYIVLILQGRVYAKEERDDGTDDNEYATVTYAVPEASGKGKDHKHRYNKTILSAKENSTGKISSKNGMLSAVLYEKCGDKKPVWKCKVEFNEGGEWTYAEWTLNSEKGNVFERTTITGRGDFDLQQIFEKNCDFVNGRRDANAEKRYLVVKFSKGIYDINNFFRIYSNTKIYGHDGFGTDISDGVVLNKKNNKVIFITFDDRSRNVKRYSGFRNISIESLTVNCNEGNKYYASSVLYAAHGRNLKIYDLTVKNGLACHAFQLTGIENSKITDCIFENVNYINYNGSYVQFSGNYASEKRMTEVDEENNKFSGMFTKEVIQIETDFSDIWGAYKDKCKTTYACPTCRMSNDDTSCNNITISGCTFTNVVRAIGNHTSRGEGHFETNVTIKNNIFNKVTGYALVLSRFKNVCICGNRFSGISNNVIGGGVAYICNSCNGKGNNYQSASINGWRNNNMYMRNGKYVKMSDLNKKRQFIVSR